MDLALQAALGLGLLLAVFTLTWVVSLRVEDASIVDPVWGPSFALVTWAYFSMEHGASLRPLLVGVLVTLWAGRLGWHLTRRHDGEDPRYAAMRERAGASFRWRSLVTVFWLQAGVAWVVSWPLLMAVRGSRGVGLLDAAGMAVFGAGLAMEAVADWQLARFRRRPDSEGQVMDRGLWRYSRHPNYFGEAVLWWGLWMFALAAGAWWTVFAPVVMTWLLLRVSGVPLLEDRLHDTRPGYEAYARRTSAFVPWPPKSPETSS